MNTLVRVSGLACMGALAVWLGSSRAFAQALMNGTGFIFEGSNELNQISLTTIRYTGECPGEDTPQVRAWFTSATTPPADRQRVVIRNVTTGTDPNDPPYTDREYEAGTASEPLTIEFGTDHSRRRFRVLPGDNEFQYEIRQRRTILESNSFTATVENSVQTQPRNSTQQTEQICANSQVALNVCADVRSRKRWVCPNGSVLRQELTPQGPIRTIIANQTFRSVSYRVGGRIYNLQSGQQRVLTGENLGMIEFPNSTSNTTSRQALTPGTRYRFVDWNRQLQLSPWANP